MLHIPNVVFEYFNIFCLQYKLEFWFSSDPTMMEDGGQDCNFNHDIFKGKMASDSKILSNMYLAASLENNNMVSEQVRHKTSNTNTEDEYRLEISDLESTGNFYPCSKNKGDGKLCFCEIGLRLCFRI